jgi:hypothetical protein
MSQMDLYCLPMDNRANKVTERSAFVFKTWKIFTNSSKKFKVFSFYRDSYFFNTLLHIQISQHIVLFVISIVISTLCPLIRVYSMDVVFTRIWQSNWLNLLEIFLTHCRQRWTSWHQIFKWRHKIEQTTLIIMHFVSKLNHMLVMTT